MMRSLRQQASGLLVTLGLFLVGLFNCFSPIFLSNFSQMQAEDGDTATHSAYRWQDRQGKIVVAEGLRSPLPMDVAPGDRVALNAMIKAPKQPGRYRLLLTMVQESVAWFSEVPGGVGCFWRWRFGDVRCIYISKYP